VSTQAAVEGAPLAALVLGAGGLTPFIGLTLLSILVPASDTLLPALASYAAVILSFVGALHWGYAVHANSQGRLALIQYGWSVLPGLVGWFALQLPLSFALRAQALAFIVCYGVDHRLAAAEAIPPWFLRLRAALSAIAATALIVASYA
jgi:Protein of unknown function (DUF3429)